MERKYNIFYCGGGIWRSSDSREWMQKTSSDPSGIRIMMEKDQIYPIFVTNVYFGAGNILKQDLLSLGGDVAVHKFFVNAKQEYGNIILLGTAKHYRLLQTKMYAQHWGLKELAEELKIVMENLLYYREADFKINDAQQIPINFPTDAPVEEAMERINLNRAKKEGFIKLLTEDPERYQKFYYPALSRGYYICKK